MNKDFAPSADFVRNAHVNEEQYHALYRRSLEESEEFWREQGRILDWIRPYTQIRDVSWKQEDFRIRWYADGTLNACFNCVDRHLSSQFPALIWEADEPGRSLQISFQELHDHVARLSNLLKSRGVKKGDRVIIYMPMIPETAYAMLACARIGAVHSVVFGGFSPESLANRINDCEADFVITAQTGRRGGQDIPLKSNADKAILSCPQIRHVLVVGADSQSANWHAERDIDYSEVENYPAHCPPEEMNAEDPLFILYTSGSTGKPKGVLHTTAGYLVYASLTHFYTFDTHPGDVYWCTADLGWITGHSYLLYGPLSNGVTSLLFEGTPHYPDYGRLWRVCDTHSVNLFYTAPTILRALMREGSAPVKASSRRSLRVLGTVGEPINPEVWRWYYEIIGERRCPIVDTWWQTETGGFMITPLPGATRLKPGSASRPFFGIRPAILGEDGKEQKKGTEGALCIAESWPGQMRTVYGDHQRFIDTYFSQFEGYYYSGDGARQDEEGYYWITGRVDDVLNVSGHRLGGVEMESALIVHPAVAEAAVVGCPHPVKGEAICAWVILLAGINPDEKLYQELNARLREAIGPIAHADHIYCVPNLPKTRSGKIMRRILRKIAAGAIDNLGDVSTLADPSVIDSLIAARA